MKQTFELGADVSGFYFVSGFHIFMAAMCADAVIMSMSSGYKDTVKLTSDFNENLSEFYFETMTVDPFGR